MNDHEQNRLLAEARRAIEKHRFATSEGDPIAIGEARRELLKLMGELEAAKREKVAHAEMRKALSNGKVFR